MSPGALYIEPNIYVKGKRLDVMASFVYLGSSLSRNGSLDAEIRLRIQKASTAFIWNVGDKSVVGSWNFNSNKDKCLLGMCCHCSFILIRVPDNPTMSSKAAFTWVYPAPRQVIGVAYLLARRKCLRSVLFNSIVCNCRVHMDFFCWSSKSARFWWSVRFSEARRQVPLSSVTRGDV